MNEYNPSIKPIETVYKGYRFRSRLEARWAVFFDFIGWNYEYEKEGYQLSNGNRYLPDFWFPKYSYFAEVKPLSLTKSEKDNCDCLARDSGFPVIHLIGVPQGVHAYDVSSPDGKYSWTYFVREGDKSEWKYKNIQLAALAAKQARFEFGESG